MIFKFHPKYYVNPPCLIDDQQNLDIMGFDNYCLLSKSSQGGLVEYLYCLPKYLLETRPYRILLRNF